MDENNQRRLDNGIRIIAVVVLVLLFSLIVSRTDALFKNPCDFISKESNGKLMCVMNISEYECACGKYMKKSFEDFEQDLEKFKEGDYARLE